MNKHIHTVILQPGTDEALFLANEAAGMEVVSNLNMFDSLISMRLSEDEVATLQLSEKVIDVEIEPPVVEVAYPTTPEYSRNTTLKTRSSPSTSGNGASYSGTNFWFHGGVDITANTDAVGFFTSDNEDAEVSATIEQNYAGEYVDIVAIEAGTPLAANDGHVNHVDFQDDQGASRFVKTNWEDYDSGLVSQNQVDFNTEFFSNHAIGVLSAAAGKFCGWSKESSMRVVYLSDGIAAAYNGVLNFHQNKPVNSATGVRNATIVTGAWGFAGVDLTGAVPIDNIASIEVYDEDGNATTINRGDAIPAEWTITLDAADASAYQVTGADRTFYGTTASTPQNNRVLIFNPGDIVNIVNNAHASHPVEIRTTGGTPVSGVTGAGTANLQFTMPDATTVYKYVCTVHPVSMEANITCIKDTSSWQDDFRPFVDNIMVPRVIEDPADSTDKWMIAWNIGSRYTTLDTILSNYNNAGGIYHFQSAGNNSTVGVKESDPRKNNEITIEPGTGYITMAVVNDRYDFTARTAPNAPTVTNASPCRMYSGGGVHDITVAACQHSTINPLLDDYSSRGPMIDIAATGAYTWTSNPSLTYQDGKWGYFSGTSCAGPVAAGTASIMVCDFFIKRGVYPTIAQLKQIMLDNSRQTLVSEELVPSWMHPGDPEDKASTRLYSSSDVFRLPENGFQNGGTDLSDLFGTRIDVINIPYSIRLGTGKYINSVTGPSYGRRPASGQTYPRRKIRATD